jgi:hypothetical protein
MPRFERGVPGSTPGRGMGKGKMKKEKGQKGRPASTFFAFFLFHFALD